MPVEESTQQTENEDAIKPPGNKTFDDIYELDQEVRLALFPFVCIALALWYDLLI